MISPRIIRTAIATVASIGMILLLDTIPWKIDTTNFSEGQLYLGLAVTSALGMFIAAFVGALIARASFIVPAVALAIVVGVLANSFVDAVDFIPGQGDFAQNIGASFSIFAFAVGGAIIGAMLGGRLSKSNASNAQNVA
ncbi:MAG: hypothetical protein OEM76_11385 [Gammaproteobacteria bacterium]|nr:hypothetical protein [Gammaproteobacteria bacterium]